MIAVLPNIATNDVVIIVLPASCYFVVGTADVDFVPAVFCLDSQGPAPAERWHQMQVIGMVLAFIFDWVEVWCIRSPGAGLCGTSSAANIFSLAINSLCLQ